MKKIWRNMGSKVTKINKKQKLVIVMFILKFSEIARWLQIYNSHFFKMSLKKYLAHYGVESHKDQYKFKLRNFVIL